MTTVAGTMGERLRRTSGPLCVDQEEEEEEDQEEEEEEESLVLLWLLPSVFRVHASLSLFDISFLSSSFSCLASRLSWLYLSAFLFFFSLLCVSFRFCFFSLQGICEVSPVHQFCSRQSRSSWKQTRSKTPSHTSTHTSTAFAQTPWNSSLLSAKSRLVHVDLEIPM